MGKMCIPYTYRHQIAESLAERCADLQHCCVTLRARRHGTSMVQVEEKQTSSSHDGSPPLHPAAAPTPPPAAAPPRPQEQANNKPSASAVLAQCLKLLKGQSDEHKFAGLVMVTKHVPALTASESVRADSGSPSASAGGGELRQICNAVGPAFLHRLLRTPGDESSGGGGGDRGGAAVGGLSVYQQIALGVLAALFQDESLVSRCSSAQFLSVALLRPPQSKAHYGFSSRTEDYSSASTAVVLQQ